MNWLFGIFAIKPAVGIVVAVGLGGFLAQNEAGIPRIMPELVSFILFFLAFRCRGELLLSRCWSWVLLLAAAAFSNRALRDAGIWTPEIEWAVLGPLGFLVFSGAFNDLLTSWSPLIRWCAIGLALSVAGVVPFIWDPYPSYAIVVVVMIHGGILLAAFAGAKAFNLKGSHA